MQHKGASAMLTMPETLSSWKEGPSKWAIVEFVRRVTEQGSPDFVPRPERIATFDNDGTLWCEQPMQVQFFFVLDRLAKLAEADPSLRDRPAFKAFLDRDHKAIAALGKKGALEVAAVVHAGVTADAFAEAVKEWFGKAKHPTLGKPFLECVYQPQLDLLSYLRTNGFKTFIVSGGGMDVIRGFSEGVYGIPPEQVVGSSAKVHFEAKNAPSDLVKDPELNSFDDRDAKPENIYLHIGRRPILAFGNSDGDLSMLRYAASGTGPRLALLLHHDDAEREFAYDRDFKLSPLSDALDKAKTYNIRVVSMKSDWSSVFPKPRSKSNAV